MSWRDSLIRISNHEVETLQKRLAEVVDRRTQIEIRLAMLEAEAQAEVQAADGSAETGRQLAVFLQGVTVRRAALRAMLAAIGAEEAGARDALTVAFESLKKFEEVAEMARVAGVKETARRETAALDEMGIRAASRR